MRWIKRFLISLIPFGFLFKRLYPRVYDSKKINLFEWYWMFFSLLPTCFYMVWLMGVLKV